MRKLLLLSGGLDSTAALIREVTLGGAVDTVFAYYGQPAASQEVTRAIAAARALGAPFHRIDVASAYHGGSSQGLFMPVAAGIEGGVDRAFVPLRNPLLLSAAAAHGLSLWPNEPLELVVGFNRGDAEGFPDCRPAFIRSFETAINLGLGRDLIRVSAPWVESTKAEAIAWVQRHAPRWLLLLFETWSCYRDRGPCGQCTACVARGQAIDLCSTSER